MSTTCDLYCCLLPQYEVCALAAQAFKSQQSGSVTRCKLHKKNVQSVQFIAKRREYCCIFSVGVALKMRYITNGMCAKSSTQIYVERADNNSVISSGDFCGCLLPQCEALLTCRSILPMATQEIYFLVFRKGGNCAPFPTPSLPDKAITIIPIKNPVNKGKR